MEVKRKQLFIIFIMLSQFIAFSQVISFTTAMPYILDENDPDMSETAIGNVNGSYDLQLRGDGSYSSPSGDANLLDSRYDHTQKIPIAQYGTSTLRIYPHYSYKDFGSSNWYAESGTPSDTFSKSSHDSDQVAFSPSTYSHASGLEAQVQHATYTTHPSSEINVGNTHQAHTHSVTGQSYLSRKETTVSTFIKHSTSPSTHLTEGTLRSGGLYQANKELYYTFNPKAEALPWWEGGHTLLTWKGHIRAESSSEHFITLNPQSGSINFDWRVGIGRDFDAHSPYITAILKIYNFQDDLWQEISEIDQSISDPFSILRSEFIRKDSSSHFTDFSPFIAPSGRIHYRIEFEVFLIRNSLLDIGWSFCYLHVALFKTSHQIISIPNQMIYDSTTLGDINTQSIHLSSFRTRASPLSELRATTYIPLEMVNTPKNIDWHHTWSLERMTLMVDFAPLSQIGLIGKEIIIEAGYYIHGTPSSRILTHQITSSYDTPLSPNNLIGGISYSDLRSIGHHGSFEIPQGGGGNSWHFFMDNIPSHHLDSAWQYAQNWFEGVDGSESCFVIPFFITLIVKGDSSSQNSINDDLSVALSINRMRAQFKFKTSPQKPLNQGNDLVMRVSSATGTHDLHMGTNGHYEGFYEWENRFTSVSFRVDKLTSGREANHYAQVEIKMQYLYLKTRYVRTTTRHCVIYDINGKQLAGRDHFAQHHYTDIQNIYNLYEVVGDHARLTLSLDTNFEEHNPNSFYADFDGIMYRYSWSFMDIVDELEAVHYIDYDGSTPFSFYHDYIASFHREINMVLNPTAVGAYIVSARVGGVVVAVDRTLSHYNESNDSPVWINRIGYDWVLNEGQDPSDIYVEFDLDLEPPTFTTYNTPPPNIYDTTPFQWNISGCADTGGSGLYKAFAILEDIETLERSTIELFRDPLNIDTFKRTNEEGLALPSNYSVWYGVMDRAGNWATTPNYSVFINASGLKAINIEHPKTYEYGSTGNSLSFNLIAYFPDLFHVKINDDIIASGSYLKNEYKELDISGYELGEHQIEIYLSDTEYGEVYNYSSFKVILTPIFVSTPDSEYTFSEVKGEFELEWEITDNELDRYWIYINDVVAESKLFTNPLGEVISYVGNATKMGVGTHYINFTALDTENIKVSHLTTVIITQYIHPSLNLLAPKILTLHKPYEQYLIINPFLHYEMQSIQWTLKTRHSDTFHWKPMYRGLHYWEGSFSLLDYEARRGDYQLWVNITDDITSTLFSVDVDLLPILEYSVPEVSYQNTDIIVSYDEAQSTKISAQIDITHNTLVREMNFEVFLPQKFSGAHNYELWRGNKLYEPINPYISEYTLWETNEFAYESTIRFDIPSPTLRNEIVKTFDRNFQLDFTLSSSLDFANLTIKNKIQRFFLDPFVYNFSIFYMYEGDWVELSKDSYEVLWRHFIEFEIYWDEIKGGETIEFRAFLIFDEGEVVETNVGMGVVMGLMGSVLAGIFWVLTTAREGNQLWWKWGNTRNDKIKYALLTVLIIGAVFGLGFMIGIILG